MIEIGCQNVKHPYGVDRNGKGDTVSLQFQLSPCIAYTGVCVCVGSSTQGRPADDDDDDDDGQQYSTERAHTPPNRVGGVGEEMCERVREMLNRVV